MDTPVKASSPSSTRMNEDCVLQFLQTHHWLCFGRFWSGCKPQMDQGSLPEAALGGTGTGTEASLLLASSTPLGLGSKFVQMGEGPVRYLAPLYLFLSAGLEMVAVMQIPPCLMLLLCGGHGAHQTVPAVVYLDMQCRQLKCCYMNSLSLQKSTPTPMRVEARLKVEYQESNSTQVLGQQLAWQLEQQWEH